MLIHAVDRHRPRKFITIESDNGIALCTDTDGVFLCLRFAEELVALQELLSKYKVSNFKESSS